MLDGVRDCLADGELDLIARVLAEAEIGGTALSEVTCLLDTRHIGADRVLSWGESGHPPSPTQVSLKSYAPTCELDYVDPLLRPVRTRK